ncbi:MAG: hypothetical protein A2826_02810 [Candidatus Doudnabacteria bacterium RIFCSPHIGHO2_01_FULL_43_23]|uniref:Ketoreductase domain-containing protein n=1 Tax=Candidatus Doudnabacteria bacterium RIFCSPHIGHO2_01_FULL_43_23 TaxID=1817822 RepID=A0A1F5NS40_9BACT|nr:MAG: hypothetical protein A2826_02810 [Candidatus Doudnabacteria bacterium RIFCSPHIGHO2_01_FULL_43_23]
MSTILVTGGAGFIGSHVSKKLIEQGHEVVIVDSFNEFYSPRLKEARIKILLKGLKFKLYRVDIADFDALAKVFAENKIDKVIHLAAQAGVLYSLKHPESYGLSNLTGTLNLLRLAEKYKIKSFVFASSSSVYGLNTDFPLKENYKTDTPISLYAATKIAGEAMVHVNSYLHGVKTTCLRFFNVYGPWMRPDAAMYIFAKKIRAREPINVYNFGKSRKDFTYIDDIVSGVVAALDLEHDYEIINLGNSRPIELMSYIEQIEKALGYTAEKNYLPLISGDVPVSHADITKAKKLLKYDPKTKIEQGIPNFVKWYLEFEDELALADM